MAQEIRDHFHALPWHDAVIEKVVIDRSNPGNNDSIDFHIIWPNQTKACVTFWECEKILCELNFGVIPINGDSILTASAIDACAEITALQQRILSWREIHLDLVLFEIETNSTASVWKIFALGAKLAGSDGRDDQEQ